MAVRMCRHCGKTVPVAPVMAYADDMECPHCQTRLTVSNGSRMFSSTVGLLVAGLVYWLTRNSPNILGFALSVLFAVLAFGGVSALVLIFTATLQIVTDTAFSEPVSTHDYERSVHDHAGLRH